MSDLLLVPVHGRDRSGRFWTERRTLPDGRVALPVHTSVAALVRCCGPDQRWVGLDTAGMAAVRRDPGYDVLLVDADRSAAGSFGPRERERDSEQPCTTAHRILHSPLGRPRSGR